LDAFNHPVKRDGWFDAETEAAVRDFQRDVGLVADGIAGPKTQAALLSGRVDPRLLRQADIEDAAKILDVEVAAIMAVNEVESRGHGFLDDGTPVVLFERHVMYRRLEEAGLDAKDLACRYPNLVNPARGGYHGGAQEWYRLKMARQIADVPAIESASWGQFQIMGYHWEALGFSSALQFVDAMSSTETVQLASFVRFIELDPALHKALKARKWGEFAKLYNGPAYKDNLYDARLAAAYGRHAQALAAAPAEAA
jgi:hypothetical protein